MFAPSPIGFMLSYPLLEFIFVDQHDVRQSLSCELGGGVVPKLNIVKGLQEGSHAPAHRVVIINPYGIDRCSWHGLRAIPVNHPDCKFAVINKRKVYMCWQYADLASIQDEGVAEAIGIAGHDLNLQLICKIAQ